MECSYWVVFAPLWLWKLIMIAGCILGIRSYILQQVNDYFLQVTRAVNSSE